MVKKCPPGVICIENFTSLFLFIMILLITYLGTISKTNYKDINLPTQQVNNDVSVEKKMPINIATQNSGGNFSQIGLLTNSKGDKNIILPLMGKLLISGRNKWQYHSMSDQNNSVRIPISHNGKSCMDEYGCDELFNGDNVYLEGYNDTFTLTLYEKNTHTYNAYL